MPEISYSLSSLIAAALAAEGVSLGEHTARQYVQECLPAPAGTVSPYSEDHVLRLRMVIRLAAQYVPLREIARYLDRLPSPALRIMLDRPLVPRSPAEGDVHAYLERLLRGVPPTAMLPILPPVTSVAVPRPPAPQTPRARRAADRPATEPAYSEWLRVVVDPDVELLVRWQPGVGRQQMVERLAAALREALARDSATES
jgi:hypothetical protein